MVNMNNEDPFSLTKVSGEQRMDALGRARTVQQVKQKNTVILLLVVVSIAAVVFLYSADVPMHWMFMLITPIPMVYQLCKLSIRRRGNRPVTLGEKIGAVFLLMVTAVAAIYLYRQLAYIQRIFESI